MKITLYFLAVIVSGSVLASNTLLPVKVNGKWGYINTSGTIIIPTIYDAADYFESNPLAKIQLANKVGMIDTSGQLVIPVVYDDIRFLKDNLLAVLNANHWGIIKANGEVFIRSVYDELSLMKNGFLLFKKDKKYGMMNNNREIILEAKYDSISFRNNSYLLTLSEGLKGLTDTNKNEILPCKYEEINIQANDRILFSEKFQWGMADNKGNILIQPEWDEINWMSKNYFRVRKGSNYTVFSVSEKKILRKPVAIYFNLLGEDYFSMQVEKKVGMMNNKGLDLLPPKYDAISHGTDKCIVIKIDGKCGLADYSGKILIDPIYDFIFRYEDNVAITMQNNLFGLINERRVLEGPVFESMVLINKVAKARLNGVLKIIEFDDSGNVLDNNEYANAKTIYVGSKDSKQRNRPVTLATQSDIGGWFYSLGENKYGLKNADGKVIISPSFDRVYPNEELGLTLTEISGLEIRYYIGISSFMFHSKYGLVDHKNYKILAPTNYLDIKMDDFSQNPRSFARSITVNGLQGQLWRDSYNNFMPRTYIGNCGDNVFRFCSKGKLAIEKSSNTEEGICTINEYMKTFKSGWTANDAYSREVLSNNNYMLTSKGGTWGIYANGRMTTGPVYQFIKTCTDGRAIIKSGTKWGIIDLEGKEISPAIYDKIETSKYMQLTHFNVYTKNPRYGFINKKGDVQVDAIYDQIGRSSEGLIKVRKGNQWGFINSTGELVCEIKYNKVKDFNNGMAAVRSGVLWGYIDTQGKEVIIPQFRKAESFSEDKATVSMNSTWSYIDKSGNTAFEHSFRFAKPFQNGIAWAASTGKYGLVNHSGEWVKKPKYKSCTEYDGQGVAIVTKNNSYHLVNNTGEILSDKNYDQIFPFGDNGLAKIIYRGKTGYINYQGKSIIKPQFKKGYSFSDGYAVVLSDSGYGIIDTSGNFTFLNSLSKIYGYDSGISLVKNKKRKFGMMDLNQKLQIFDTLNNVRNFSEGKAVAGKNNAFYYIDQRGNVLFNKVFEKANDFIGGFAIVKLNGLWGVLNEKGIYTVSPKYAYIDQYYEELAGFKMESFCGILDVNGHKILGPEYEYIKYCGDYTYRVERNGRVGYAKLDGTWLWEPKM